MPDHNETTILKPNGQMYNFWNVMYLIDEKQQALAYFSWQN